MALDGKSRKWAGLGRLILGSKSWSRRTLLETLGVGEFEIIVEEIDEKAAGGGCENPRELVTRIGLAKARAVARKVDSVGTDGKTLLVCGDSMVAHKGGILGKPRDLAHARSVLRSYSSGAPATTVSSIVVVDVGAKLYWDGVDEAEVYFRPMPDDVIEELVLRGGAMESAGALRIEHPLVAQYTECIMGHKSAVMGFSTPLAERLLGAALKGEGGSALR